MIPPLAFCFSNSFVILACRSFISSLNVMVSLWIEGGGERDSVARSNVIGSLQTGHTTYQSEKIVKFLNNPKLAGILIRKQMKVTVSGPVVQHYDIMAFGKASISYKILVWCKTLKETKDLSIYIQEWMELETLWEAIVWHHWNWKKSDYDKFLYLVSFHSRFQ